MLKQAFSNRTRRRFREARRRPSRNAFEFALFLPSFAPPPPLPPSPPPLPRSRRPKVLIVESPVCLRAHEKLAAVCSRMHPTKYATGSDAENVIN